MLSRSLPKLRVDRSFIIIMLGNSFWTYARFIHLIHLDILSLMLNLRLSLQCRTLTCITLPCLTLPFLSCLPLLHHHLPSPTLSLAYPALPLAPYPSLVCLASSFPSLPSSVPPISIPSYPTLSLSVLSYPTLSFYPHPSPVITLIYFLQEKKASQSL